MDEEMLHCYLIGQALEWLSINGQNDVSLPNLAALLCRLTWEQCSDSHDGAGAERRVQLCDEKAEAQTIQSLLKSHLLNVICGQN